ncbi:site-specific integrase [bacterium]|nr:site-specific integrase [bacterium]
MPNVKKEIQDAIDYIEASAISKTDKGKVLKLLSSMLEEKKSKARRGNNEGSIRQRANGVWEARYTAGYDRLTGKQIIKSVYASTRSKVHEKLTNALSGVKEYGKILADSTTVSQWLDVWLKEYKIPSCTNRTVLVYQNAIDKYLKPAVGATRLDKLDTIQIQRYVNELATGNSKRMTEIIYGTLRGALIQAQKTGVINRNPCLGVVLPKGETNKGRALTIDEQTKFMNALEKHPAKTLFYFYLYTGARRGEALAIKWDDINFEEKYININKTLVIEKDLSTKKSTKAVGKTKTLTSNRIVPMVQQLEMLLLKLERRSDLVFPDFKGEPQSLDMPDRQFKALCETAKIEGIKLHDLRHTFATRSAEKGIPLKVIQSVLGHASLQMTTDTYIDALKDYVLDNKKAFADLYNMGKTWVQEEKPLS